MNNKFDPKKHHRRSIRLKGYDCCVGGTKPPTRYRWHEASSAAIGCVLHITIVVYRRQHFFGEVVSAEMRLNELGRIARAEWFKTAALRSYMELYEDKFVVMPNHVHGIIWINNDGNVGAERRSASTKTIVHPGSLGAIIRGYKSAVTYAVNALQNQRGAVLWQCNYYARNSRR